MQPSNILRLLRALSRQGLDVQYDRATFAVRWLDAPDAPIAEVLLPENFPVEAKALKQLANLAIARHPVGGHVCRVCATPDFHPGDAGVAIGSVVETAGQVIPAAVGSDINCGMRLHVADLSVTEFLAQRDRFVELMKGDFFFGKRDVTVTAQAMRSLFQYGALGWLDAMLDSPTGSFVHSDIEQIATEIDLGLTGVDCITLREERRIEEAPAAYKPIQPVIDAQVEEGLVQVVAKMRPILTFKA